MRTRSVVLLAVCGFSAAALAWRSQGADEQATRQLAQLVRIATVSAQPDAVPDRWSARPIVKTSGPEAPARVFSPQQPVFAAPSPDAAPRSDAAPQGRVPPAPRETSVPATAPSGLPRMTSARPADDASRRALARSIQIELKRVGCFAGDADGLWSSSTRKAMQTFIERINASLPVESPDYILLTLLQGQHSQICGKGCPVGQAMSLAGRCEPRAILARKAKPSQPAQPEARPVAEARPDLARPDPSRQRAADAKRERRMAFEARQEAERREAEQQARLLAERQARIAAEQRRRQPVAVAEPRPLRPMQDTPRMAAGLGSLPPVPLPTAPLLAPASAAPQLAAPVVAAPAAPQPSGILAPAQPAHERDDAIVRPTRPTARAPNTRRALPPPARVGRVVVVRPSPIYRPVKFRQRIFTDLNRNAP